MSAYVCSQPNIDPSGVFLSCLEWMPVDGLIASGATVLATQPIDITAFDLMRAFAYGTTPILVAIPLLVFVRGLLHATEEAFK